MNYAARDGLTSLLTRGAWLRRFHAALSERSSCIAFFDLDRFKRVNDTHGHDVGDDLLRAWAKLFVDVVGDRGDVGRWGSDEDLANVRTHQILELARPRAEDGNPARPRMRSAERGLRDRRGAAVDGQSERRAAVPRKGEEAFEDRDVATRSGESSTGSGSHQASKYLGCGTGSAAGPRNTAPSAPRPSARRTLRAASQPVLCPSGPSATATRADVASAAAPGHVTPSARKPAAISSRPLSQSVSRIAGAKYTMGCAIARAAVPPLAYRDVLERSCT